MTFKYLGDCHIKKDLSLPFVAFRGQNQDQEEKTACEMERVLRGELVCYRGCASRGLTDTLGLGRQYLCKQQGIGFEFFSF